MPQLLEPGTTFSGWTPGLRGHQAGQPALLQQTSAATQGVGLAHQRGRLQKELVMRCPLVRLAAGIMVC